MDGWMMDRVCVCIHIDCQTEFWRIVSVLLLHE